MSTPININRTEQAQIDTPPNRGYDNKIEDYTPLEMTLYTIDNTIITHIRDTISPTITDEQLNREVPVSVVYGSPERWKTVRRDANNRDPNSAKMEPPVIIIKRTNLKRDDLTNPNNKYLYSGVYAQWNKRNAYDRFAVQNRVRPSQQIRNIVIPDYVTLTYEVILWTEKQSQLNQLIEQINFENEEYWGDRGEFKFKVKILDYNDDVRLPTDADRAVKTSFSMNVFAYLLPEKIIKNFQPASPNSDQFTVKKIVTFIEIDQT